MWRLEYLPLLGKTEQLIAGPWYKWSTTSVIGCDTEVCQTVLATVALCMAVLLFIVWTVTSYFIPGITMLIIILNYYDVVFKHRSIISCYDDLILHELLWKWQDFFKHWVWKLRFFYVFYATKWRVTDRPDVADKTTMMFLENSM